MERFDVSEGDRLAEMVSAAQRNGEVEITENGEVVARIMPAKIKALSDPRGLSGSEFLRELKRLHRELPPVVFGLDWSEELRAMRDEY